ncbi:hypothetical protein NicSoilB8_17450 [Arthrobacter sp. NicSoilB8]|nr:hypothetical protein NicSoilB8_17450 [Arthrobacter sp. NicSoilB8]
MRGAGPHSLRVDATEIGCRAVTGDRPGKDRSRMEQTVHAGTLGDKCIKVGDYSQTLA